MNFRREFLAVYDLLDRQPLSPSAMNLWTMLMIIHSKAGCPNEFTAYGPLLRVKTGIAESTFSEARNSLVEKGLIVHQQRSNYPPIYRMQSIVVDENGRKNDIHSDRFLEMKSVEKENLTRKGKELNLYADSEDKVKGLVERYQKEQD